MITVVFLQISCKQNQTEPDNPPIVTKIIGRISNKTLGIGVSHVKVTTNPATSAVFTDTSGYFEITIPQGSYVVSAEKNGYENNQVNVTVAEGATVHADMKMSEAGLTSDAIKFILIQPNYYVTTSVILDWTINPLPSADFASYKIYRDKYPDVTQGSELAGSYNAYGNTYDTLKNLETGSVYYFRVYAINKQGSAYAGSNIIKVKAGRQLGTWTIQNAGLIGLGTTPKALYPLSDNDVWAVGTEIWHWNGSSWKRYPKPFGITRLNAVYFAYAGTGYAVGEKGEVIKFDGTDWTRIDDPVLEGNNLYDVVLSSANDVWVSCEDGMLHFDGAKWSKLNLNGGMFSFDMVSANEIWAVDNSSQIFLCLSGQWKKLTERSNSYSFSISAVNPNDVWLDIGGMLYHYDGSKLTARVLDVVPEVRGIELVSSTEGWAYVLGNGLLHYDGEEWKWVMNLVSAGQFASLRMLSAKSGWGITIGSTGTSVVKYTDTTL